MSMQTSHYYRIQSVPLAVIPSYLFLEFLAATMEKDPSMNLAVALQVAATTTYPDSGPYKKEELEALGKALSEEVKEEEEGGEVEIEIPERKLKLGMGTQYIEWLSKLSPQDLCLTLADYDPSKAEELYCYTDYRLVTEMGRLHLENRWHGIQAQYDAAMYAFGGSYKGDKSSGSGPGPASSADKGQINEIDLTKPNPAAIELLKKSGF